MKYFYQQLFGFVSGINITGCKRLTVAACGTNSFLQRNEYTRVYTASQQLQSYKGLIATEMSDADIYSWGPFYEENVSIAMFDENNEMTYPSEV